MVDSGGLVVAKRIEEVRDFDLRIKTHPTSKSINALTRRIGHVSSDCALGCASSPLGSAGETIQLAIDHATEVFS